MKKKTKFLLKSYLRDYGFFIPVLIRLLLFLFINHKNLNLMANEEKKINPVKVILEVVKAIATLLLGYFGGNAIM